MIHFQCECGADLHAAESRVGKQMWCRGCDDYATVPYPGSDQPDQSNRLCPECDSPAIIRITRRRDMKRKLGGGDPLAGDAEELNQAFVFRLPRECRSCGAIWVPPVPRWAGMLILLAGLLLLLFFLGLPIYLYFFAPPPRIMEYIYVSGGICVGAVAVIGYGWHITAGGSRRARMLRSGNGTRGPGSE
jgi:hypothetical protein